jgi:hypothetical protein
MEVIMEKRSEEREVGSEFKLKTMLATCYSIFASQKFMEEGARSVKWEASLN